ncbi:GNAT family N-acetyltransferase [Sulfobacillus harzensis]|uniref:GNAT family N-acetyltransferase n=1 Tax=Sulfobacillus harzensis TaxID=2729629 RepID=A0A7Y0Q467_9FIRM|nr:GNAT family N-acetyltransferase [Sulfobacillus harzensis]
MSFDLMEVMAANVDVHRTLYRWDQEEIYRERFTCRPVSALPDWDAFMESIVHRLRSDALRIFVLWDTTKKAPIGRVTTFDHNPRNRSAEFGYYLPPVHRQHGYGREMVRRFLSVMFSDGIWRLHKLYATTASGNIPSIRLLEGLGFHLDGIMREHYWFETEVQDQRCYSLLAREWTGR